jgi:hypothetical protein
MEIYLSGVFVAFLINLVQLVIAAVAASSQRIKNIEKTGRFYNITEEGRFTKQKPTWGKTTFYLVEVLTINPSLSWFYVCYFAFTLVKTRVNRAPLPERLKEIQYKLSSANLPRETVKDCLNEIAHFYGVEIDDRNPYEDDYDKNIYIISSGSCK